MLPGKEEHWHYLSRTILKSVDIATELSQQLPRPICRFKSTTNGTITTDSKCRTHDKLCLTCIVKASRVFDSDIFLWRGLSGQCLWDSSLIYGCWALVAIPITAFAQAVHTNQSRPIPEISGVRGPQRSVRGLRVIDYIQRLCRGLSDVAFKLLIHIRMRYNV